MVQSFASHDHNSSIRSLACSGHYLASGATDDRIIIYDLKSRREHCMLTHHNSTINCIQFTNNRSHVISSSADGVLSIVRVGNWQLEKLWEKPHNGKAILDIAVHPSGKLAFTLGADTSLRTWNLIKGRQAYVINLNSKSKDAKSLEKIIWAEDEVHFILYGGRNTEIWSIETGGILKSIEHDNKVCSCLWYNNKEIIVGYENGQLARINIESGSKSTHEAHESRVKALAKYKKWIVSASSAGEIKVWNKHFENQASINTGCRITCMIITKIVIGKKVEKDEDLIEVKDEYLETPTQKGSVVIVEMEDDDSTQNKNKVKRNKRKHSLIIEEKTNEMDTVVKKNGRKKKRKSNTEQNEIKKINVRSQHGISDKEKKKKNKKSKIKASL